MRPSWLCKYLSQDKLREESREVGRKQQYYRNRPHPRYPLDQALQYVVGCDGDGGALNSHLLISNNIVIGDLRR